MTSSTTSLRKHFTGFSGVLMGMFFTGIGFVIFGLFLVVSVPPLQMNRPILLIISGCVFMGLSVLTKVYIL
jgi:hypothetical protein